MEFAEFLSRSKRPAVYGLQKRSCSPRSTKILFLSQIYEERASGRIVKAAYFEMRPKFRGLRIETMHTMRVIASQQGGRAAGVIANGERQQLHPTNTVVAASKRNVTPGDSESIAAILCPKEMGNRVCCWRWATAC